MLICPKHLSTVWLGEVHNKGDDVQLVNVACHKWDLEH